MYNDVGTHFIATCRYLRAVLSRGTRAYMVMKVTASNEHDTVICCIKPTAMNLSFSSSAVPLLLNILEWSAIIYTSGIESS